MNGFVLTWLVFALALALLGARAWVVETNRGRFSTGSGAQRGMTVAVAASLVLLVVMAAANGGIELIGLLAGGDSQVNTPADVGQVVAPGTDPGAGSAGQPAPVAPAPAAPANP